MPTSPSKVSVAVEPAVPRGVQSGIPVIVGYDSSYATANKPIKYHSPDTLKAAHGDATKTTKAAQAIFRQRARSVVVIKPAITAVADEAFGTVATGTLANTNVTKTTAPVATIDGATKTVLATDEDPITAVPAAGEILLNFKTGEWKLASAAVTDVVWDYSYVDYTAMESALKAEEPDLGPYELFMFPGYDVGLDALGDLDALTTKAESNAWFVLGHVTGAATVATAKKVRTAIKSGHLGLYVHKEQDGEDVAAVMTGVVSRVDPYNTTAYKRTKGLDLNYYLPTEVGDVETADTFEGEGLNVLHKIGPFDVATNERTTLDYNDASGEIYISRVRGRINLQHRLKTAIDGYMVESPKVALNQSGIGGVVSIIQRELEDLVTANSIERGYVIKEPVLEAIPTTDKKARRLGTFEVTTTMVESGHQIVVNVTMEVA